jgi:hypothetical protein
MFTYSKERVVRRDKINFLAPKPMCGSDIKKLWNATFLLNINEFDLQNEFIKSN